MVFEINGYIVFEAVDGKDGLIKVHQHQPDIVLLDVMMPNMNGIEVCQRLRSNPETAAIPIIMLSGAGMVDDINQGLLAGATKYVTKPVPPRQLLDIVLEVAQAQSVAVK